MRVKPLLPRILGSQNGTITNSNVDDLGGAQMPKHWEDFLRKIASGEPMALHGCELTAPHLASWSPSCLLEAFYYYLLREGIIQEEPTESGDP